MLREDRLVQPSLDMHVYGIIVVDHDQFISNELHVARDKLTLATRIAVPYPPHLVVGLSQPLAENSVPDREVGAANELLLMKKAMQLRSTANGRTSVEASCHLEDVEVTGPAGVATRALQRK